MTTREDYEQFFREADKDNSGTLTFDELLVILRRKGYKKSDEELKVWKYDKDLNLGDPRG